MEDIWLYYFFCTFDLSLTYYLVISNFYGVFLMLVETAVIWSLCLRPIINYCQVFSTFRICWAHPDSLWGTSVSKQIPKLRNSPILLIISGQSNAGLLFKIL